LYVTYKSGVSKYSDNIWSRITPKDKPASFNALGVNPTNPNDVLVASSQSVSSKIYRTLDGGSSWTELKTSLNHTVPWWDDSLFSIWISAIEFDPQVPGKVWLTNGFGIWQTENINANPVVWTNHQQGHEEIVPFALTAPPQGAVLLSGIGDVSGFHHNNGLTAYPSNKLEGTPQWRETFDIAYSISQPSHLVRVGGARWNSNYTGVTSTDGGLTWKKFSSFPQKTMPLRVAISATNPKLFVLTNSEAQPLRTTDGGRSWSQVSGLPDGPKGPWYWKQPLAADPVDGDTFYYYSQGKVYRSTDGGTSFNLVNSSLPYDKWDWYAIKTIPGVKDEVWLGLDKRGLFRSIDGGKTFAKLSSVKRAHLFAFGKPPTGSTTPALYLYGQVQGNPGQMSSIFRSLDQGETWTSIGSTENPIGNEPNVMAGSWQNFGLVFIGTNGRGIFYGTPD
ncbi:MAG: hypothetical protein F6K47_42425, partial [Symploca sp. SIO2E6]|nr:hypothetical protein [Symploca sp. SIO2E6]